MLMFINNCIFSASSIDFIEWKKSKCTKTFENKYSMGKKNVNENPIYKKIIDLNYADS